MKTQKACPCVMDRRLSMVNGTGVGRFSGTGTKLSIFGN